MQDGHEQGYGGIEGSVGTVGAAGPSFRSRLRSQRSVSMSVIEFTPDGGVKRVDDVESEYGDPPLSLLVEEVDQHLDQKAFVDWRGWKD